MNIALELKEQTIEQERGRLLNFIKGRVSNAEDAEDILQEVFFLFVDRYEIDTAEKAVSWLFTVARNKIVDKYRKKKLFTASIDSSPAGYSDEDNLMLRDILPDLGTTPEDIYFRNIIWEKIWEALNELPEAQREIFVQHELEGRGFREISEESGVSINTLLSRKRYAVQMLQKSLTELYDEL